MDINGGSTLIIDWSDIESDSVTVASNEDIAYKVTLKTDETIKIENTEYNTYATNDKNIVFNLYDENGNFIALHGSSMYSVDDVGMESIYNADGSISSTTVSDGEYFQIENKSNNNVTFYIEINSYTERYDENSSGDEDYGTIEFSFSIKRTSTRVEVIPLSFYKSTINQADASINGGEITDDIIENNVSNNLVTAVKASLAENGGERWFKFYLKATVDTITLGFDITSTTSPTEEVYIALASSDAEVESNLDKENIRVYGAFQVSSYDDVTKTVTADRDVTEFIKADDFVTFYDANNIKLTTWEVESVNATDIIFKSVSADDVSGLNGCSTIKKDELSTDAYVGFWIKQVILPFTASMEDPLNEFSFLVWYDLV